MFAVAIMGCLLRLNYTGVNTGLAFGNLLHAHSHTAIMGWLYVAVTSFIYSYFLSKPGYKLLFGITIISVVGLMISFALQGYGTYSIFFCCLHLLCTYIFIYKALKELALQNSQSVVLIRISLYLLIISTLGLWGIGPSMTFLSQYSGLFSTTIQWYIHFQFNGFFYFAIIAIFFKCFDISIDKQVFNAFLALNGLATALTFALPVSWYFPAAHLYYIQLLGAVFQVLAVVLLFVAIHKNITIRFNGTLRVLFVFSVLSFVLKTLLPALFFLPDLMHLSHEIRSIAIAYIHLMMLGMVSGFLVFFMIRNRMMDIAMNTVKWGIYMFIGGFILTEFLLLLQSMQLIFNWPAWQHIYKALAVFSLPLPIAALCWILSFKNHEPSFITDHSPN